MNRPLNSPNTSYETKVFSKLEIAKDLDTLTFHKNEPWHHAPKADPACGLSPDRTHSVRNLGVQRNYVEHNQVDDEEDPDFEDQTYEEDQLHMAIRLSMESTSPSVRIKQEEEPSCAQSLAAPPDHLLNVTPPLEDKQLIHALIKAAKRYGMELVRLIIQTGRDQIKSDRELIDRIVNWAAYSWAQEDRSEHLVAALRKQAATHETRLIERILSIVRSYGWMLLQDEPGGERKVLPVLPRNAPVIGVDGAVPRLLVRPAPVRPAPAEPACTGWLICFNSNYALVRIENSPTNAVAVVLPNSIEQAELQRFGLPNALAWAHAAFTSGARLRFHVRFNAQIQSLEAFHVRAVV